MNTELTNIIKELNEIIYNNESDTSLEKNIYKLIRQCLKTHNYEVEIGNYHLNIKPNEIYTSYEIPSTILEVTEIDTYIETERDIETRFFCLTNETKDNYLLETPTLKVEGKVFQINNTIKAEYIFNIFNNQQLNIKDYTNNLEIIDEQTALLEKDITINDKMINPLDYLHNAKPVYLDYKNGIYINKDYNYNETYSLLVPNLSKEKDICLKIYKYIINFYNEYSNNSLVGKSE